MKLLTKELERQFSKIGKQQISADTIVVCKFFNPTGAGTWWCTEYSPKDRIFYGFVSLFGDHNDEWGSFSLDELQEVKGLFGLGIERDLYFKQQPISQACPKAVGR